MISKYIRQIDDERFADHKELIELRKLGHGLCGNAFLTKEGLVVKENKSRTEYDAAKAIKGYQNKHIVDIYDCYEDNNAFYILEEYLIIRRSDMLYKFTEDFRSSWSYFAYYPDMKYILANNDKSKLSSVLTVFRDKTKNDCFFEQLFHETCMAIKELYNLCPKAFLDIHSNNIGYTQNNTMKYFDISA